VLRFVRSVESGVPYGRIAQSLPNAKYAEALLHATLTNMFRHDLRYESRSFPRGSDAFESVGRWCLELSPLAQERGASLNIIIPALL